MSSTIVQRVRSVPGVSWAVPLSKGLMRAKLPVGRYQQAIILGLDDASYVGAPGPDAIVAGSLDSFDEADAILVDVRGAKQMWPDIEDPIGMTIEMNDHRVKIVGLFTASQTFQFFPVVVTRYSRAINYRPPERKVVTFIPAAPETGVSAADCCAAITKSTGLMAQTQDQFIWTTIDYYLLRTGIPINFGITVLLGFMVGLAISGQTFYQFTVENLRYYATFKAIGETDRQVAGMVLGLGLASAFGIFAQTTARLAYFMPWQVVVITCVSVMLMILLASLFSLRRLFALDPADLFRGAA